MRYLRGPWSIDSAQDLRSLSHDPKFILFEGSGTQLNTSLLALTRLYDVITTELRAPTRKFVCFTEVPMVPATFADGRVL